MTVAALVYRLMTLLALLVTALLETGTSASAQPPPPGRAAITPRLIAETSVPAAGGRVTLAIVMTPRPGWHGYWRNPGDAGVAPRIDWTLPADMRAGALQYPVPGRLIVAGLMNYVYEDEYALLVTLDVPRAAAGTVMPLRAEMEWLACTDQVCVPERGTLALDLPVADGAATSDMRARFDGFRRALPRPLAAEARFAVNKGRFRLAVPLPGDAPLADAYFFPDEGAPVSFAAAQSVMQREDEVIVDTAASGVGEGRISGVLALGDGQGFAIRAMPGAVPPVSPAQGIAMLTLLAFVGAVAGGLVLNVMPCVFPILSLKALSLARGGGSARKAKTDALAYAGGAVLTCAGLGATLLALRAGGAAAGWAFQLQDPRVVLVLLLLTTGIALNLAGLFEVPALGGGARLASGDGTRASFWTGVLAAFVATPCTGPFLGAALGASLVLPPVAAMAIFVGLGLGLALPFLALGFVPALRRRLPKPGPWMASFRRILSVPMFATALALAWVLGRQSGVAGMSIGLGAALVAALALWWFGRRQAGGTGRPWLPAVPLIAAAFLGVAILPSAGSAPVVAAGIAGAERFDEARLAGLRGAGRPVFLYFTADWCVSCKVNERVALDRDEVRRTFANAQVAVMVGDWTNGDPTIGRFLERQGRSGVPLYLYYAPGAEPRVLPQILTPGMLTGLVR